MKILKGKYSSIYDMMNTSGFGWEDEKKCVVMDSLELLQIWLKVHHFSFSFLIGCFESLRKKKEITTYYCTSLTLLLWVLIYKHPNAIYKPNKSFLLYPQLCMILGET